LQEVVRDLCVNADNNTSYGILLSVWHHMSPPFTSLGTSVITTLSESVVLSLTHVLQSIPTLHERRVMTHAAAHVTDARAFCTADWTILTIDWLQLIWTILNCLMCCALNHASRSEGKSVLFNSAALSVFCSSAHICPTLVGEKPCGMCKTKPVYLEEGLFGRHMWHAACTAGTFARSRVNSH